MRTALSRLLGFLRGRRLDHELDDEVALHLELAKEDYVRRGMSEHEARAAAERRDRQAFEFFYVDEPRAVRGRQLVVDGFFLLALRGKQVAVETFEVAVDVLRFHDRFDPVDGGRMALGGEPGSSFAVHALDFGVAVVDRVGQMRGGVLGHAAADRTVVDDDDRFARLSEQVGGGHSRDAREIWVRYVEGLYRVWGELRRRHPNVIWENCSGGGGRVDMGMMALTEQSWTSDNTLPPARLQIQEGYSQLFPANTMAAWVTDEHKDEFGLELRFHASMAGALGVGGNLLAWTDAECAEAARHVALYKEIRPLVAGGDRIHAVEGVLSGSLAWLFDRYDGSLPFSQLVREAAAAGYTEPDPRVDLSGEDVRRKLLILARAAGLPLERAQVRVESLLPPDLADAPAGAVDDLLALLDAPLSAKLQAAGAAGHRLRFVARFDGEGASVGVRALPASHPLCAGSGTDNRVAVSSDRYPVQPLVIQGPGAGADVTAAALLDDVLRISAA